MGIPLAEGVGSMPFDVLFFCGGCLAKKNKWLKTFEEAMRERRTLGTLRVTAFVVISLWAVGASLIDIGPFHLVAWYPDFINREEKMPSPSQWLLGCTFFGLMTTTISMNLIQLFSVYGNFSNKTSQFFSEAAYGVYILHAAVWPVVSYTYVLLLRAISDELVFFSKARDGQIVSCNDIGTWRVVLGFLYTFFLSNLILWPLAFYLRKLPGLRNVL